MVIYLGASQVALLVKNLPANVRDVGSIPGSGRSPGGRHGNPLQYSCLENPMDRGAWQATVYRVVPGAVMGGPACDEVMKKIPGRQGRPGPHPWRGHKEKTWPARLSRIRDPPGWPQPLPHPVSSPLFCCCSCSPCFGFLCCLPRALLLLFHWMRTNLKP